MNTNPNRKLARVGQTIVNTRTSHLEQAEEVNRQQEGIAPDNKLRSPIGTNGNENALLKLYTKLHSPEFAKIIVNSNKYRLKFADLAKKPVRKFTEENNLEAFDIQDVKRKFETLKSTNLSKKCRKQNQLKEAYSQVESIVSQQIKGDEKLINRRLKDVAMNMSREKISFDILKVINQSGNSSKFLQDSLLDSCRNISVIEPIKTHKKHSIKETVNLSVKETSRPSGSKVTQILTEREERLSKLNDSILNEPEEKSRNKPNQPHNSNISTNNPQNKKDAHSSSNILDDLKKGIVSFVSSSRNLVPFKQIQHSSTLSGNSSTSLLPSIRRIDNDLKSPQFDKKDEVMEVNRKFFKKYQHLIHKTELQKSRHKLMNVFEDKQINLLVSSNSQTELENLKSSYKIQLEKATRNKNSKNERKTKSDKRMKVFSLAENNSVNHLNFCLDKLLTNRVIGEMGEIAKKTKIRQKIINAIDRKNKHFSFID